ncbi:MFS transporter [Paenibacillus sp. GP183]|uniref:MFS transporter n=1 Tax=Paenibacillus sp. GP183 TaxID=1882751 RepID=UPI00089C8829|nr:MFS transporter [Paenibacillus sp. GP183]SEC24625.1 Major Facilitator Superfamily protein [Paenibacillus sp. GP183]
MGYMPNVWKLFASRFFSNLIPAYVIERLYWEERGMTIQMVVYTEIIFAITIVLLEIPTGIIADKWGRKQMMILSALMGCCEFVILLLATEFWHFALVVFLAAIGRSASSGAENALLYDSLLSAGKEHSFEKYLGRLNALDIFSIIIAALCGSFLAGRYGYELNYWISLVSMLVALILTLTLVEPAVNSDSEQDQPIPIRIYVAASLRYFKNNPGVRLVVLSGMVTGAAISFIDEFWQTYLERLGIPVIYFGMFSAAIYLLRLPGNLLAYLLKSRFSYKSLLFGAIAVFAAGFLYVSVMKDYSSLAAICLIGLFAGMIEPLAAGYLHHRMDSSMRATIGSFQSLGEHAAVSVIGIGFGYFSAKMDIFGGFGFVAMVCWVFLIYFSFASAKRLFESDNGP